MATVTAVMVLTLWCMGLTTAGGQQEAVPRESSAPAGSDPGSASAAPPTAEPRVPLSPLTSYLFVPGSALKPRFSSQEIGAAAGGGCVFASPESSRVLNLPVELPPGSLVESVRFFFDDTSSTNGRAWFTVYDEYGNIVVEFSADSSGNGGEVSGDTGPINQTIDYNSRTYALNFRPQDLNTIQLCGARIAYRAPAAPLGFFQAE